MIVGAATLPLLPAPDPISQVAWVVAAAGAALMADLDTTQSSAARMWGPISGVLAAGIGAGSGGHRQGTHDLFLAPLVFGSLAWAATLHQVSTVAALALLIGLSLRAVALLGRGRIGSLVNLLASLVGAYLLASNATAIALLPIAVVIGILTHIAGDWLTSEGVPVPIAWIRGSERRCSVGLFQVGSPVESFLVAPLLSATALALIALRLGMGDDPATFQTLLDDLVTRLRTLLPT